MQDVSSFSRYLTLQAQISFGQEVGMLFNSDFLQAQTIVDAGCGNAAFLSLLAEMFPEKDYIGIDSNDELLAQAVNQVPKNVKIRKADLLKDPCDAPEGAFVVSRLVSIYLNKPEKLAEWASRFACASLIIEPNDELFQLHPPIPEFLDSEDVNSKRISSSGGSRAVVNRVEEDWTSAGFRLSNKRDILIQSTTQGNRHLFAHMMALHFEIATGRAATNTLLRELYNWQTRREAYAQYGLRAFHFCRNGS